MMLHKYSECIYNNEKDRWGFSLQTVFFNIIYHFYFSLCFPVSAFLMHRLSQYDPMIIPMCFQNCLTSFDCDTLWEKVGQDV